MKVCIIPARGGSKRIPRKNIKDFCGKPMIAYSIEAAQQSGLFDLIIVSTDDQEIAEVARTYGAKTPFVRPKELSDDHTATIPVIAHAIKTLDLSYAEAVCCLYATAPFVRAYDLQAGYKALIAHDKRYAFPVTSFPFPIFRAVKRDDCGNVEMFWPEHFGTRSQDLPEAYHDAGQFYWGQPSAWLEGLPIFAPHSTTITLPRYRVQDIDTLEDWERAEVMFHAIQSSPS